MRATRPGAPIADSIVYTGSTPSKRGVCDIPSIPRGQDPFSRTYLRRRVSGRFYVHFKHTSVAYRPSYNNIIASDDGEYRIMM